jgi:nucleoside-diphosphate-sugar epimerase
MKEKILLIGGQGYIGSYLSTNLDYEIQSIDLNLFPSNIKTNNKKIDFNKLDKKYISKYDHIILLAGHSSVRMCDIYPQSVFNNNVRNFINLLEKISPNQTFIYASSASVYGDCKENIVFENQILNTPYNMYDYTKQAIDSYINISKKEGRVYGLRFGTVNGYSPNLRSDIMLNAMTFNAFKKNEVLLFNSDTKRSILCINDLLFAVQNILKSSKKNGGIYNIASFTKTSEEMAKIVSNKLNVKLKTVDKNKIFDKTVNEKLLTNKYNFALDCSKFEKDFSFTFTGNIDKIIDSLVFNWNKMLFSDRNESFLYKD